MGNQKGFTLVELAIVMIIIGLLLGGVLKGQELVENAKVTAVISQVKGFQAALNGFRDSYGALAGDMANATTRVQGCAGTNNCVNGNGNAIIGAIIPAWDAGDLTVAGESAQFFKHLALADLIIGIDPTTNNLAWGDLYPPSSLRGGYSIAYTTCAGGGNGACGASPGGLVLRMHNGLPANAAANIEDALGAAVASSLQASNIDRKLDDGIPNAGWVRSIAAGNGATTAHCEGTYDNSKSKDCTLLFQIDG